MPQESCLPQYFFHLTDIYETMLDQEGRTLGDLAGAKAAALREARAMISADALAGRISLRPVISVVDGHGRRLHTLRFDQAVEIVCAEPE